MGLEDWEGLLSKYAEETEKPFAYYKASSNSSLPLAASMLANDFHDIWWKSDKFAENRETYAEECTNDSSALKIEICEYLKDKSEQAPIEEFINEIEVLKTAKIDGIITTNWDNFLERLFDEYKVFVGQEGIIFNNFYGVGEIFKIHGCLTQPNSLILTDKDYSGFDEKYAYLSSKLLTFFVEHPVIFISYSLSDENISQIIESIGKCLTEENLSQLRDRIIIVDWCREDIEEFTYGNIKVGESTLQTRVIKTNSFLPVFKALSSLKRRFPAKILRKLKEQVFELVKSNDPKGRVYVSDLENAENDDDLEVVFGVGTISKIQNTKDAIGYIGVNRYDLMRDVVFENGSLDPLQILSVTSKTLPQNSYFPVFKYLSEAGRISDQGDINLDDLPQMVRQRAAYTGTNFQNTGRIENIREKCPEFDEGIHELYEAHGIKEVVNHTAKMDLTNLDMDEFSKILKLHFDDYMKEGAANQNERSQFGKLICFYDWVKYAPKT